MKFSFGSRFINDPSLDKKDTYLYVHNLTYDSDISKLPKLVPNKLSKNGYELIWINIFKEIRKI